MKIALLSTLSEDQIIDGSTILPFDKIVKKSDDLEVISGGVGVKALRSGPLAFNVTLAGRNGEPLNATLFKNGAPFRSIASGLTQINATVIDATAEKGDEYGIQVGGSAQINSEPLYTSLSIIG